MQSSLISAIQTCYRTHISPKKKSNVANPTTSILPPSRPFKTPLAVKRSISPNRLSVRYKLGNSKWSHLRQCQLRIAQDKQR